MNQNPEESNVPPMPPDENWGLLGDFREVVFENNTTIPGKLIFSWNNGQHQRIALVNHESLLTVVFGGDDIPVNQTITIRIEFTNKTVECQVISKAEGEILEMQAVEATDGSIFIFRESER